METWLFLALLAPLFYALSNMVDKFLLDKRVKYCFALAPISGLCALVFGVITFFFISFKDIPQTQLIVAFLLGLGIALNYVLYYYALSFEEVSRVVSIWYLSPVFVLLFATVFLGEHLPLLKIFAVLLAVSGAVLIGFEKFDRGFVMRRAFYWVLFNCLLAAVITTVQKYLLGGMAFWNLFCLQSFGLFVGLSLTLFSGRVRAHFGHVMKSVHLVIVTEVLTFVAAIIFLSAMSRAEVAKVSALSSVQPIYLLILMLISSLFIPHILKEEFTRRSFAIKVISVLMVVVGAYFIAV